MSFEDTNIVRRDNKIIVKNVSALGDAGVIELYSDDEVTKVGEITAAGVGDFTTLKIGGNAVTSTPAEINALDGIGTTGLKVLKHTVTAGEAAAGTVSIAAGLTVAGFVCNILRAGNDLTAKAALSGSTTNLVVATNGADYVLTEGDVIQAIAWA